METHAKRQSWSFSHQIAALTQRSTAFDGAGQPMENTIAGADTVSNPPVDCKTRTRKQRKTALKNIIPLRGWSENSQTMTQDRAICPQCVLCESSSQNEVEDVKAKLSFKTSFKHEGRTSKGKYFVQGLIEKWKLTAKQFSCHNSFSSLLFSALLFSAPLYSSLFFCTLCFCIMLFSSSLLMTLSLHFSTFRSMKFLT